MISWYSPRPLGFRSPRKCSVYRCPPPQFNPQQLFLMSTQ